MENKTKPNITRPAIADDATIQEIVAALGLKASDWRTDLPEVSLDDDDAPPTGDSEEAEESRLLGPAEIIDQLKKLGQTIPAAHQVTQKCIGELEVALGLVGRGGTKDQGGWRVRGLPPRNPTPAEDAERIAMLLGQAFTLATSLARICEDEKGYDVRTIGLIEASLERLSDSPETFKEAVLTSSTKPKPTQETSINH